MMIDDDKTSAYNKISVYNKTNVLCVSLRVASNLVPCNSI